MNWTNMETYGEAPEKVFEDICCHLCCDFEASEEMRDE